MVHEEPVLSFFGYGPAAKEFCQLVWLWSKKQMLFYCTRSTDFIKRIWDASAESIEHDKMLQLHGKLLCSEKWEKAVLDGKIGSGNT